MLLHTHVAAYDEELLASAWQGMNEWIRRGPVDPESPIPLKKGMYQKRDPTRMYRYIPYLSDVGPSGESPRIE